MTERYFQSPKSEEAQLPVDGQSIDTAGLTTAPEKRVLVRDSHIKSISFITGADEVVLDRWPTIKRLKDQEEYKKVGDILGARYKSNYKGKLENWIKRVVEGSSVFVVKRSYSPKHSYFYIQSSMISEFREAHGKLLESDKIKLRKVKAEKRKQDPKSKLTPQKIDEITARISESYGPKERIFYRYDAKFLMLAGISRETFSRMIILARKGEVVPLPNHKVGIKHRPRSYYSRDEIIKIFEHTKTLKVQGVEIFLESKKAVAYEKKRLDLLTFDELAEKLKVRHNKLKELIINGQIEGIDEFTRSNLKRINNTHNSKIKMFSIEVAQSEHNRILISGKGISLSELTLSKFQRNRDDFRTVLEVIKAAGLGRNLTRYGRKVADYLRTEGIAVKKIKGGSGFYHVLKVEDLTKAAIIIKNNKSGFNLLFSLDKTPLASAMYISSEKAGSQNYVKITSFVKDNFGVSLQNGARNVEKLFRDSCPVKVFRHRLALYIGKDDCEIVGKYLEKRLVDLGWKANVN